MPNKSCSCGSGLDRTELVDAAGIFCTFVCQRCEPEKRRTFRPEIFEQSYDPDEPDVTFFADP